MKKLPLIMLFALWPLLCPAQIDEMHPKAPAVPSSLQFAGETVTFGRDDLYERMDRELMTFTYMHSTSTLMLKRSGRYFKQVEPILKEEGLSADLKYLMVIESNLDPKAVSTAGAAGLWQFTKATAKTYGLEVSDEVDERYNTEKATRAACRYLRDSYKKYGDWLTVAASYNAGQNGISRRLKEQQEDCAADLWLPEETSRYMFRMLAAKMLFEDPARFGFAIEEGDLYPYRAPKEIVTVTGPIASLVTFAKEHGVSYADLKRANLWLRSDKLTNAGGKSYRIVIPDVK